MIKVNTLPHFSFTIILLFLDSHLNLEHTGLLPQFCFVACTNLTPKSGNLQQRSLQFFPISAICDSDCTGVYGTWHNVKSKNQNLFPAKAVRLLCRTPGGVNANRKNHEAENCAVVKFFASPLSFFFMADQSRSVLVYANQTHGVRHLSAAEW
jgi:hypothetical protein